MSPNDNRRPGVAPRDGGADFISGRNAANVIPIRPKLNPTFDQLTARLVLARHREGTLDPAILAALLAGVGLHP
jgi:hypothetical protein